MQFHIHAIQCRDEMKKEYRVAGDKCTTPLLVLGVCTHSIAHVSHLMRKLAIPPLLYVYSNAAMLLPTPANQNVQLRVRQQRQQQAAAVVHSVLRKETRLSKRLRSAGDEHTTRALGQNRRNHFDRIILP